MRSGFIYLALIAFYMSGFALCITHSTMTLSVARYFIASTSAGDYALFGGGSLALNGLHSDVVDIYNIATTNWTIYNFEQPRNLLAATSVGRYALFGGGLATVNTPSSALANVDIFDSFTGNWTKASLSAARYSLTATSVGKYALFAGGYTSDGVVSDIVDIFDSETLLWSNTTLSQARAMLSSTATGRYAYFAGGVDITGTPTSTLDIFDSITGSWNSTALSAPRSFIMATSVGNTVIFGGGTKPGGTFSNAMEIYDSARDKWTIGTGLETAKSLGGATTVGNYALFGGGWNGAYQSGVSYIQVGDNFGISGTSLTPALSPARYDISAVSVGPFAMFAGGYAGTPPVSNMIDVYDFSAEFDVGTKPNYNIVPILECVDQNGIAHFGYQSNETQTVVLSQISRNFLSPQHFFPVVTFRPGRSRYYPANPSRKPLTGPGPFTWKLDNYTLTFDSNAVQCPTTLNVLIVSTVTGGQFNATKIAEIMRQTFATLNSLPLSRVLIVSVNQNKKRMILDDAELLLELSVLPSTNASDPTAADIISDFVGIQQSAYQYYLQQNVNSQNLNVTVTVKDVILNPTDYIEGTQFPQAPNVSPVSGNTPSDGVTPSSTNAPAGYSPSTSPTSVPQTQVSEAAIVSCAFCTIFVVALL